MISTSVVEGSDTTATSSFVDDVVSLVIPVFLGWKPSSNLKDIVSNI
tara:strand:+ start:511 stop:651 length:141 start_codon:yes stop_codon:yes gene_type:complete